MRHYKVYRHPAGMWEAVKIGWSWPAFFFAIFWSLVKKLWVVSLVLLGIALLMGGSAIDPTASCLGQLIIACVLGYNGNRWREDKLKSVGYEEMGTAFAENAPSAVAKQIES